jgi:FMN phosphatase YigB (HAD superfamily)
MIKAIIFDCFGVVRTDALDDAYRSVGGDPDKDRAFIRETLEAANSGKIPRSIPVIAAHLGISDDEWFGAIKSFSSTNTELLAYAQGLRKKYKVSMLSNISKGGLAWHFEPGFLEQYFDDVVESGAIGVAKPEARAYEIAADRLDVRLDECVFIDDRQEYIEGAQAVGMQTILYTSFKDFKTKLNKLLAE